ncbi:MAG: hypothetical protein A2Y97_12930 [Nitrospirae bacterium RBG_13_39_12]|nr:MAG: hypothetical protein A2Y97_12930 [Nitrospirae bacterium RBG_13_39_12]
MKSVLLLTICLILWPNFVTNATDLTVALITDEEGALQEAPLLRYRGIELNDGPDIRIVEPDTNMEHKSPIKILIQFIPREGREIDLSKFKVEYLKLITIDLTSRILPYTNKEMVKVDKAEMPRGKHKIKITIGDTQGGITRRVVELKII